MAQQYSGQPPKTSKKIDISLNIGIQLAIRGFKCSLIEILRNIVFELFLYLRKK